jgi:hypothetical protein
LLPGCEQLCNLCLPAQAGIAALLDGKAEPQETVLLDNYVQPVDRGPSGVDPALLRSWQMKATGKLAAAAVLSDLRAERLRSGKAGAHVGAAAIGRVYRPPRKHAASTWPLV